MSAYQASGTEPTAPPEGGQGSVQQAFRFHCNGMCSADAQFPAFVTQRRKSSFVVLQIQQWCAQYNCGPRKPMVKSVWRDVCSAAGGSSKVVADSRGSSHARFKRARAASWVCLKFLVTPKLDLYTCHAAFRIRERLRHGPNTSLRRREITLAKTKIITYATCDRWLWGPR